MFKRINWKSVFTGFCWICCLSGLIVLMSFIEVKKSSVKCTDVRILIPGSDNFIEREEINAILREGFGQLKGRDLEGINIHEIEKGIKANPYIAFAKVYADMDGVIKISVKQRQPVLRVINAGNQDFYIDDEGNKMPVSSNFTANVLVATGNIMESFGGGVEKITTKMLSDLYKTATFIKNDTLWDAQIEQIFVDENADIELVPRVGNQQIILGNADLLETKMKNLLIFYKKAMPKVGWNAYKTINVKYLNQIVCVKNTDSTWAEKTKIAADTSGVIQVPADSLIKDSLKTEPRKTEADAGKVQMEAEKEKLAAADKKTEQDKIKNINKKQQ